MNSDRQASAPPAQDDGDGLFSKLRGEVRLRTAIDDVANQLCQAVDGDFDFSVRAGIHDETLEKLAMLTNFVLDTARRGMAALRLQADRLAELDLAKTVFFSNASHELRTPLTLILGPLEDALARERPELSGEALASAHRNALRLLKLVNALLDFSRIEAGRLQALFQPTDLAALTTELAGVFRSAIERAGLTLTVDVPPLAEPVYVDRAMWEKIVLNLLSNAFKFTFDGGIRLSLRRAVDAVELEVADSGVGIPPDQLPRVFERFHRVEGTRARTHEGFGIGLAMIHELVRLHGGRVDAASTPGHGSSFTVSLPLGRSHLPAERVGPERDLSLGPRVAPVYVQEAQSWNSAPDAPAASPVPEAPGAESARILVADDNADMREYVRRLLGAHWTVQTVSDGSAALAAALAAPPDLVVSDVMMPVMDGHALVRALRAEPRTAVIPVLLLSARAGDEATTEGLDSGADDYVVKPFSGRELVARVRTHLNLSRLRSDAATIERIGALLNSRLELQDVVQMLTDEATRLCGAQLGAFFYNLLDDAGESYMLYTLSGVSREAFAGFPMPRKTAIFAPTFAGERIMRLDDVTRHPDFGKNQPYHGMPAGHLPVRSYLAVPVVSRDGTTLGGLFFGHSRSGVFTERSERLLGAVAHHAAVAIENAHLFKSERKARADAEAATRAKDEFLAMLGHELRNPLAPITTALELMEHGGSFGSERARGVIQRQVGHMVRLVDDLLDVSRIARGKLALATGAHDMVQVVAKAVEIASPLLDQRRHRLHVEMPASLPVAGDFVRLTQVVSNLLANAAKFTPPGGDIRVHARVEGFQVVVQVTDTGIGIAPEDQQRIFEMFSQAPQPLARSEGGLGLGLAIARNIVQMHGGTIEVRSPGLGQGSEFVVRLPARAPDDTAPAAPASAATEAVVHPAPALRVLIVDDNVDGAAMLAEVLAVKGHQARTAHDGPSALKLAATFRPDCALVDIGLPVMDGYELAQRLRALPQLSGVRLIALTGYGQEADRQRSREAGFDAHLVKPVDFAELEATLPPPPRGQA